MFFVQKRIEEREENHNHGGRGGKERKKKETDIAARKRDSPGPRRKDGKLSRFLLRAEF